MSEVELMSGNEAAARGAIEAGVSLVASYPGEPVSPIVDHVLRDAKKLGIYVEWSVNEKVAYEQALGASFLGLRALAVVKHVGFNWILDPFAGSAFSGIEGGLVVIVGDDPGGKCSTSEEDTRYLTELAEVPLLEPSTPQEVKDMTVYAFDLSEEVGLPVVVRLVTRLCNQRAYVTLGPTRSKGKPKQRIGRRVVAEALYSLHEELWKKNLRLRAIADKIPFNIVEKRGGELGIITCNYAAQMVSSLPEEIKKHVGVLKVGITRPAPERIIREFASQFDKILVVEEVQPFLERKVREILRGMKVEIYGKLTGHIPPAGELEPADLLDATQSIIDVKVESSKIGRKMSQEPAMNSEASVTPCVEDFHPRCPHRSSLQALRSALRKVGGGVVTGDVGCMSLDFRSEEPILESMIAMGSSIGIACGVKLANPGLNVVAVIGDSSFYHDGLQGLMDAFYHGIPIVVLILDNMITAQTGFQPDPGSGVTAMGDKASRIPLEELLSFMGDRVKVVNASDLQSVEEALIEALKSGECRVVISRGSCPLLEK